MITIRSPFAFLESELSYRVLTLAGGFGSLPRESLEGAQQFWEIKGVQLPKEFSFKENILLSFNSIFPTDKTPSSTDLCAFTSMQYKYNLECFICAANPDWTGLHEIYADQWPPYNPGNPGYEEIIPRAWDYHAYHALATTLSDNMEVNGIPRIARIYEKRLTMDIGLGGRNPPVQNVNLTCLRQG